mmetsp:Transcript_33994/g.51381  ORF Transcript_33994/g.51381 Transcript_33994/m.51381 type:complete len:204 (+) Transcript_33994:80-691(+)
MVKIKAPRPNSHAQQKPEVHSYQAQLSTPVPALASSCSSSSSSVVTATSSSRSAKMLSRPSEPSASSAVRPLKSSSSMPSTSKPPFSSSSSLSAHRLQSTFTQVSLPSFCNFDHVPSSCFRKKNSGHRFVLHLERSRTMGLKKSKANAYSFPVSEPFAEKFRPISVKSTLTFIASLMSIVTKTESCRCAQRTVGFNCAAMEER